MGQNNDQGELVDLSQVLDEGNEPPAEGENGLYENAAPREKIPGLYGVVAKFSGGLIKTEGQAKAVLIILIILMNLITFSLLFQSNKTAQQADVQTDVPAAQP